MLPDTPTPCYGKHALFDSINPADHHAARALCLACPLTRACAQLLEDTTASGGVYGHPEGTWAGQLITPPTEVTRKRLSAISRAEHIGTEDARYTDETARQAHSAYSAGDRSEWATTGHRVYDRRRRAKTRKAVA